MKKLALLLLVLVIVLACSPKVQVVTLRGSNVSPSQEGLVLDNDTLILRYNFASERGLVHITVINKLNQPLYVDWKRSSFIIGQDKFDYWHDIADVNLTGASSSYGARYGQYSFHRVSGFIAKEAPIDFIPPQTKLDKQQFLVVPNGYLALTGPFNTLQETGKPSEPKTSVKVVSYAYSKDQSPLTFRNYLTLSTDKDFKTEFHIDTQFWASDVQVMPKIHAVEYEDGISKNGFIAPIATFKKADSFYVPIIEPNQ